MVEGIGRFRTVRPPPGDSPSIFYPSSERARNGLDEMRVRHHQIWSEMVGAEAGDLYGIDLFMSSVLLNSYHLTDAFLDTWDNWNIFASAPLFRVQADLLSRVAFMAHSENSEEVVRHFLTDGDLTRFPTEDGKRVFQSGIQKVAYKHHPWLKQAYKDGSDWVHFSSRHYQATWSAKEDRTLSMSFPLRPGSVPELLMSSLVSSMNIATLEILRYVETWRQEKIQANASLF